MDLTKRLVWCEVCGECLGNDDKPGWGAEHIKKYPNHKNFFSKKMRDTLTP